MDHWHLHLSTGSVPGPTVVIWLAPRMKDEGDAGVFRGARINPITLPGINQTGEKKVCR